MKITQKILEKLIREQVQTIIEDKHELSFSEEEVEAAMKAGYGPEMSFTVKEVEDFNRKQDQAKANPNEDPIKQKEKMIKALEAKIKNEKDKDQKKKLQDELKKLKRELAGPGASSDQSIKESEIAFFEHMLKQLNEKTPGASAAMHSDDQERLLRIKEIKALVPKLEAIVGKTHVFVDGIRTSPTMSDMKLIKVELRVPAVID